MNDNIEAAIDALRGLAGRPIPAEAGDATV
jgi:hypothetical protein